MSMGNAATFVAAAVLASATSFAQTPAPDRATSTSQNRESPATQVTLIGCVQRESDYRREHNIRRGGGLNTGLGSGDEYVLINATRVSPGSAPASGSADCAGSGEAFEITGPREEQFKAWVGKRVEVTGMQKRARTAPSGQPTGGTDPIGGDLGLFEVEVSSVKEPGPVAQAQRSETQAETQRVESQPPAPAPAPERAAAPAPTGTAGAAQSEQREARQQPQALPSTASPLPLYGLASLLLFGGAYGVRRLRTK